MPGALSSLYERARTAGRRPRPRDRRRQGLGDRSLRLPLPLLHAGGGPAVARSRRAADLRGDRAARRACSPRWGCATCASPAASRSRAAICRGSSRCSPRSRSSRELALTTNGYLLERDAEALVAAGVNRFNVSVDSLQRERFSRDDAPRRAGPGAARARGARDVPAGASDQDQRGRDARLHRARGDPVRALRPRAPLRGSLHRVHAARRRSRVVARRRADRRGDPRRDRRGVSRSSPSRARGPRRRGPTASPTDAVASASSTPSRSRSARTATASASPPTASCGRACSRSARPICARCCAAARTTTSSRP